MTARGNQHIQKYNQLVEVYDPDGVEKLAKIHDRDAGTLAQRRETVAARRELVGTLAVEEILSDADRAEIEDNENLPAPEAVAAEQRAEMVERLELIAEALAEAHEQRVALDADDFDGFEDPRF